MALIKTPTPGVPTTKTNNKPRPPERVEEIMKKLINLMLALLLVQLCTSCVVYKKPVTGGRAYVQPPIHAPACAQGHRPAPPPQYGVPLNARSIMAGFARQVLVGTTQQCVPQGYGRQQLHMQQPCGRAPQQYGRGYDPYYANYMRGYGGPPVQPYSQGSGGYTNFPYPYYAYPRRTP